MGRYEYLLHLLFQRALVLREEEPGFDGPNSNQGRKR
jgi:hypothetical protein